MENNDDDNDDDNSIQFFIQFIIISVLHQQQKGHLQIQSPNTNNSILYYY
jgi:hypothetical protein